MKQNIFDHINVFRHLFFPAYTYPLSYGNAFFFISFRQNRFRKCSFLKKKNALFENAPFLV